MSAARTEALVGGLLWLRHLNETWSGPVGPILPAAGWAISVVLLIAGGLICTALQWWRG